MAVRILQLGIVFAIGFGVGPASGFATASVATEISLSLHLQDPRDVTVVRGQAATLRCEASSTVPGLVISWLYDGSLLSNDTRKQILSNGTLHIPKVSGKRMEGSYQCLAKNKVGSILSNPANLKILTIDREFQQHPKNTSVFEFQPVVLLCRVRSMPDAVIHWERDGKPLPHNLRYVPLPSGALLITSTHSTDAGIYRCNATNKILNKTRRSKIGQLTVLPPLATYQSLQALPLGIEPNQTVASLGNLTLFCAISGWPLPSIRWIKDNDTILSNSDTLVLINVTQSSAGEYLCSAVNSEQQFNVSYRVNVAEKPRFNSTPVSISYPSARTVRLDCQAQGTPPPKITWLKNGRKLETFGRIKVQPSGLVFSHSFTTDEGMYQCVAENLVGRTWAAAQLVPYFSENRPNPPQSVRCESFNDNSVCLTWDAPYNASIQAYSIFAFSPNGDRRDFVTNYTYYLATGLDNSTNYTVYVRSYSKDASDQSNNVSCRAGIKGSRNLQIQLLNDTSVSLSWSKVSNDVPCGSSKVRYKIQWKRLDLSSVSIEQVDGFSKVISGLRPLSTYEFKVQSILNKNEEVPYKKFSLTDYKSSLESTVATTNYIENDTSPLPIIPQQVEALPLSPNSVNLTWLNVENHSGIIYTICYIQVEDEKRCENGQLTTSVTNYLVIENLNASTLYEFKVRSEISRDISSLFSHSVQVQTYTDKPSSVLNVRYRVINASTACVTWRNPLYKNGKIIRYTVSYTTDPDEPVDDWNVFNVTPTQMSIRNCWPNEEDSMSMVLTSLKASTRYTVVIRAVTKAGQGNISEPISFSTKEKITIGAYPEVENRNAEVYHESDPYYNQKLGIALGISVSIFCIFCCISCIMFRKRCLKREALRRRAQIATSSNHYPSSISTPYPASSLYLRHQETCTAEAHEMQHLVNGEEGPLLNITAITTIQLLDTKGGSDFPNGNVRNGMIKHPYSNGQVTTAATANGRIPNGLMHITENPRYNFSDSNGATRLNGMTQIRGESEGGGERSKKNGHFLPDYNSNCDDSQRATSLSKKEDDYLNATQLTCLDDTFSSVCRISPALGPNG